MHPEPTSPTILILAAGASRRMRGRDKLLEPVEGQPLLRRQAAMARATGMPVLVALAAGQDARQAALDGLGVQVVQVRDAAQGLSATIRAGVAALPTGCPAVILLLADLPEIEATDLQALIAAQARTPDQILQATTSSGKPGHPVLFPRRYFTALGTLTGDHGARDLLAGQRGDIVMVPLPGNRALTDLDTPEDWESWHASQAGGPDTPPARDG
jgi:molybdenum cofactor cytidylyltransferase